MRVETAAMMTGGQVSNLFRTGQSDFIHHSLSQSLSLSLSLPRSLESSLPPITRHVRPLLSRLLV